MGIQQHIVGVICDEHCRAMDFHIAGLHVNGAGFELVAGQIKNGGIAVCPQEKMSTPGRYRFTRDELKVKSDIADSKDVNSKSVLVHEAVHAMTDIRKVKAMTGLQSEAVGFLAQTVYKLKVRKGKKWSSRVPIFTAALDIAVDLKLHEKKGVTVKWDDYAALRKAIREHVNYKNDDHNAKLTGLGIKKHRGKRCR